MSSEKLKPMLSRTKRPTAETSREQDNSRWGTPEREYNWIDSMLGITLDVCADDGNAKHPRYFNERQNGLAQSWRGETFWCNPSFADSGLWLRKGVEECMVANALGCFLVPSRVDAEWWRNGVMQIGSDAGKLVASRYVAESGGVLWLRFRSLVVGVYHHDQRLQFEGAEWPAPFPVSFVFMRSLQRTWPRARVFRDPSRSFPVLTAGAL